jgi:hypothetical protein
LCTIVALLTIHQVRNRLREELALSEVKSVSEAPKGPPVVDKPNVASVPGRPDAGEIRKVMQGEGSQSGQLSTPLPYRVEVMKKQDQVHTPYGNVIAGVNTVVVHVGNYAIPMPPAVLESLLQGKK